MIINFPAKIRGVNDLLIIDLIFILARLFSFKEVLGTDKELTYSSNLKSKRLSNEQTKGTYTMRSTIGHRV